MVAAMTMVLGMTGLTAFAAGEPDGSITIQKTVTGEVYKVYKVFDAVPADANETQSDTKQIAYTYTKNNENDAFFTALTGEDSPFKLTQQGTSNIYNVEKVDGKTADDIVTFLNGQVDNLGTPVNGKDGTTATAKAEGSQEGNNITIDKLSYGYYYITTTTGSAVTINSAAKDVTVEEKNTVPSITKTIPKTSENAQIGDTIPYTVTVKDGKGTDKAMTISDEMSNSLTLDTTSFKINGTAVQLGNVDLNSDGKVDGTLASTDAQHWTLTLNPEYVASLDNNATVKIEYNATLNKDAVVGTAANNTVTLQYSHQTTTASVDTNTYSFGLHKHAKGETTNLADAEFELRDGGKAVNLVKVDETHYRVADTTDTNTITKIVTVESGDITISGIDNDTNHTYTLVETKAPAGFNQLTAPVNVTAKNGDYDTVDVENSQGSALPSTGGIGTTIFYILGAVLVIGAGVVLVTRRRLSK